MTNWVHPLVRAASTPITGADVPPAPRPSFENKNAEPASARDIQMAPCPVSYGPFLPPEPRDCVIPDPARTPMDLSEIINWNRLVSRGSNEPIIYSGVPLVRYSDLAQGRNGGDMNNTTHRGNEFGVLGRLDPDGRPIVPTDRLWMDQGEPQAEGTRVIVQSPFYPLPDQDVQDIAWKYPQPDLITPDGQPVYNFSYQTWEGFTDYKTSRTWVGLMISFIAITLLWRLGNKNLFKK